MKKKIKKEWVAALRSGDYKQGKGALRRDDTYCCFGVLCELAVAAGVADRIVSKRLYSYGPAGTFPGNYVGAWAAGFLPSVVSKWAGLGDVGDVVVDGNSLADLNDNGATFQDIANIIEAEL